jgi:hypothetical protein
MNSEGGAKEEWPWPEELDALRAAGDYHRLVFENAHVRVLEVRIAPGQVVPVHTHRWPSVAHTESSSDFVRRDADGKVTLDTRRGGPPPKTQWLEAMPPHSVENVGGAEIRVYVTELKDAAE